METDRPHRSNCSNNSSSSSSSELFICFTSRLSSSSSSSMKISSKSILSPGRSRESSQISLSTSLSRRLRSNGSMKGGQASPMFPTNAKKRGCSFENPEPSSPKVTCIGQVRVKTKKQGKKFRTRSHSQRRSGSGEVSFRRIDNTNSEDSSNSNVENHRNQKWVHLPLTICETLREFNCFLPCRSSCSASEKDKEEKAAPGSSDGGGSSCGAVFTRWLVAVQEGDGRGREIELVVGGEEEEEEERRSYRRHIFEEFDYKEERNGSVGEEGEGGRVSICIPPKNALLLMRCRSDPVKMAALANKFCEPTLPNDDEEEQEPEPEPEVVKIRTLQVEAEDNGNEEEPKIETLQIEEKQTKDEERLGSFDTEEHQIQGTLVVAQMEDSLKIGGQQDEETEIGSLLSGPASQKDTEDLEKQKNQISEEITLQESEDIQQLVTTTIENDKVEDSSIVLSVQEESGQEVAEQESDSQELAAQEEQKETTENSCSQEEEEEEPEPAPESDEKENPVTQEGQTGLKSKERESQPLLPDCLLLMMCEPKLSMEVSKETWVCSTDFIRWLPEPSRPVKRKDGGDQPKKKNSIDVPPPPAHANLQQQPQPPRSSCSYPAKPPARAAGAESMSSAIEQKLVGTKAYGPFVLTRCKSEPMRSASKLASEACFWKNRKLELHRPATLGVGAGGVGC